MKDQLEGLLAKGIHASCLNSSIKNTEKTRVLADLRSEIPCTKLLYMTPEGISTDQCRDVLNSLHKRKLLTRLVVDEV